MYSAQTFMDYFNDAFAPPFRPESSILLSKDELWKNGVARSNSEPFVRHPHKLAW